MLTFVSFLLTGFAALLAIAGAVLLSEVLAACLLAPRRIESRADQPRGRVAILVPAHNEGSGVVATLDDLKGQLRPGDRLLVVADNCTDDTAEVAASSGAEVTIRSDPARIGKGYALDWGMARLRADPPDIVIVVDADCRIKAGAIDLLAGARINHQVAEFAWLVKNKVRPLGLRALTLPCQLMGTGMAFPWIIIEDAALSNESIVEDLKLGLELGCAGHQPLFCPSAVITSTFPDTIEGARKQRQRWEHGHVWLILTTAPALFRAIVKRRDLHLLALWLDLLVPPLSLFGVMLVASVAIDGIALLASVSHLAFFVSLVTLCAVVAALGLCWFSYARAILPPKSLLLIASYFVSKLRMYGAALLGHRVSRWTRADRG